jgi:hypothetical protein
MLRKLFSSAMALGLAVSVSIPARAELLKNFKTDGSLEVKAFGIDNETDRNGAADDYRGETHTRVMVGGSFDLLDDVHARILLRKNNYIYGGGGENANTVQTNIVLDNAFVKIDKVFGRVDLTMGRQFYGDSNDLVIYFGPQPDDLLSVTAVDVFRADADLFGGWAKFEGIAGKIADTGALANSDTDLFGAKVLTDKVIPKGALSLSYYTRKIKGAGATANNTLNVADLSARGDILETGLSYQADYVQNFGRNAAAAGAPANDGNAYFLGLRYGHTLSNMPFRAMLEYGRGTTDFAAIAPGKRFGKIWGEHSNFGPSSLNGVGGAGLSNLQVIDAGVGINPIERLGVDVNAYRFTYDSPLANGNSNAGTEYDLILSWKHSDNVSFETSAATFQVGDALRNAPGTGTSPITRLGADVKIKF